METPAEAALPFLHPLILSLQSSYVRLSDGWGVQLDVKVLMLLWQQQRWWWR